jgi:Trypsin-like peptidase domain
MLFLADHFARIQVVSFLVATILMAQSKPGVAMEASEVFKVADPSIVVVMASDDQGDKGGIGSGVLIAPLEVLTSCKVIEHGADIIVTQGNIHRSAKLRHRDIERDLCQLTVDEPLPAAKPVAALIPSKDVEVGKTVFTISAPRGMEHTIGRTMVSGLREMAGGSRLILTDAFIAAGSNGGGVFDQDARLVGIMSSHFKQGENLSAVIPTDWIGELAQRSPSRPPAGTTKSANAPEAVSEKRPEWMPRVGDRWTYKITDFRRPVGNFTVEITDIQGKSVKERFKRDRSGGPSLDRTTDIGFSTNSFLDPILLPGGYQVLEFAPYPEPSLKLAPGEKLGAMAGMLNMNTLGKKPLQWQTRVAAQEQIRVPAGEFETWKVEAKSEITGQYGLVRITANYWYSVKMGRTVKMVLKNDWTQSSMSSHETYELVSFEPGK